ncbi:MULTISPECIES: FAD-dependent monooxygenase [unclassified Solwaraspora]|uniref:FAD-dependent monooxygenase n=1 Tax=unclassified Solwaraspora TaxID=2627926 RepID=UPI00259B66B7|nr:FAD-dependent monooxygenase [Solwaraspora sp. WMMA2056]WJK38416.1 FAD-dependent monooxygenase [Solwaraspora sp. WMMA2056]
MNTVDVEVLIVGGGPVGLSASIELSRHGVTSLLVEKHAGTSIFPKARLVSTRTMEIFRSWGIQDAVEQAGLPRADSLALGIGSALTAADFQRAVAPIHDDAPQSPTYTYICSQDRLEVILRALATGHDTAQVRFATTMTRLRTVTDGVEAVVDSADGRRLVRARYAIAADGGRSGIRAALGIGVAGPPPLGHMLSVMFDADLRQLLHDRLGALYFVRGEVGCAVEAVDNVRRWIIQTAYEPELGQRAEDFTEEVCLGLVRAAVGIPDLPVEIIGTMPWLQQAIVADEFRRGPIFLAGDAAHVATPQGGFGMNCGIQDAHNLGWKLAAALHDAAGARLLDSYPDERRPVAEWTVDESLNNALITVEMMEGRLAMQEAGQRQADRRRAEGMVLGYRYDSSAVIPDGTDPPAPDDPYRTYVPTARPGHRAPHVWLSTAGTRVSTLDLIGPEFTLMTPAGSGWAQCAKEASGRAAVGISAVEVSSDDSTTLSGPDWADRYGLSPRGAVLIRPDGHVAWRCVDATPSSDAVVDALDRILDRTSTSR